MCNRQFFLIPALFLTLIIVMEGSETGKLPVNSFYCKNNNFVILGNFVMSDNRYLAEIIAYHDNGKEAPGDARIPLSYTYQNSIHKFLMSHSDFDLSLTTANNIEGYGIFRVFDEIGEIELRCYFSKKMEYLNRVERKVVYRENIKKISCDTMQVHFDRTCANPDCPYYLYELKSDFTHENDIYCHHCGYRIEENLTVTYDYMCKKEICIYREDMEGTEVNDCTIVEIDVDDTPKWIKRK